MDECLTPISARMVSEQDDLLPIRIVETLPYCPRQTWYRFVAGDDALNEHMERGLARHRTFADSEAAEDPAPGTSRYRHLPVSAPGIGVMGVLDEVDIRPDMVTITEYKTSKLKRLVWSGVRLQLGVQYLALREQAAGEHWHGPPLPAGVQLRVYYTDSRRYRQVAWNSQLEHDARQAVAEARTLFDLTSPPPGIVGPRCDQCQHEPICLPFLLPLWKEVE